MSKGAHSFEDMTNISIETRAMLESNLLSIISRWIRCNVLKTVQLRMHCLHDGLGGICFDPYQHPDNSLCVEPSGLQFDCSFVQHRS
jgi:hypothetical protein